METIGSRHGLTREDLAVLPSFWRAGAELTVDRHSLENAMWDSEDDAAEPAVRDMGNALQRTFQAAPLATIRVRRKLSGQ